MQVLAALSSNEPCPDTKTTALHSARDLLYPLPHPPPISVTSQMLSYLPENWTLCQLHLLQCPAPVSNHVLVIVRAHCSHKPILTLIPIPTEEAASDQVGGYYLANITPLVIARVLMPGAYPLTPPTFKVVAYIVQSSVTLL